LKRSHSVGLNLDHALIGFQPNDGAVGGMALGVDSEAVGEDDELAGLRRERNPNKTQQQFQWTQSHSNHCDAFAQHAVQTGSLTVAAQSETANSPGTIGRVRGSTPCHASHPKYARIPANTASFSPSAERECC